MAWKHWKISLERRCASRLSDLRSQIVIVIAFWPDMFRVRTQASSELSGVERTLNVDLLQLNFDRS